MNSGQKLVREFLDELILEFGNAGIPGRRSERPDDGGRYRLFLEIPAGEQTKVVQGKFGANSNTIVKRDVLRSLGDMIPRPNWPKNVAAFINGRFGHTKKRAKDSATNNGHAPAAEADKSDFTLNGHVLTTNGSVAAPSNESDTSGATLAASAGETIQVISLRNKARDLRVGLTEKEKRLIVKDPKKQRAPTGSGITDFLLRTIGKDNKTALANSSTAGAITPAAAGAEKARIESAPRATRGALSSPAPSSAAFGTVEPLPPLIAAPIGGRLSEAKRTRVVYPRKPPATIVIDGKAIPVSSLAFRKLAHILNELSEKSPTKRPTGLSRRGGIPRGQISPM